jgi:HD-GYP domain-containing protein (c-di-GMP phosphodiesterase class II)
VRHHHERFDGRGYPDGRRRGSIPVGARILAVCDAFDAMTSRRPYRPPLPLGAALAEIRRARGSQFDPRVADAFLTVCREGGTLAQP